MPEIIVALIIVVLVVVTLASAIKIIHQQKIGLVERLGKFHRRLNPGPHLVVPIIDRAVRKSLGRRRGSIWQPLQVWIQDSNHARPAELERIRSDADLSHCPSILRVFDVLAWRVGTGKTELPTQA